MLLQLKFLWILCKLHMVLNINVKAFEDPQTHKAYSAKIGDPEDMPCMYCLLRQSRPSENEIQHFLENCNLWPLDIY